MKQTLILLIGILVSTTAFSQNKATELYTSGNSNFKSGNFQEAISNYTELIEIVEEKSVQKTCFINRGLSYDRIKKYDLAISDFTEAIKLDSTDMASFIDRGLSLMHAGKLERAKEDYNYVVLKNNNNGMMEASLYWLARINYSQGKFEDVIKNCDKYFTINPKDPELYFIRGTANDMLRNFEQSIIDYSKAIELKPNYVESIANRGTAKVNLLIGNGNLQPSKKETKSACKDLKKAKELGDNAVEDLIYIYCGRKEKKKRN
ncbi:tetratricopeptide repeat protein [Algibacter lectus]|uniref:Tetratricopeptide repeat protein n=2 Tax=Flavobacteriaceae TaxID=49546 RepID=A0A4V3HHI0_9FLAO|nr:tetratricopeptide repeat protein [Algibacter lectus]MWW26835.1 tetratricopeptide repeat protein [Algibacter lectus]TDY65321.1 tetratricopeptide repeat protein [Algibacter lectus]